MEEPSTSLRRSPRIAFSILLIGVIIGAVGLILSDMYILALGVMPVLLSVLMMINPMVVVTDKQVELKNIFGFTGASYEHDGIHLIQVQDDVIFIQKGEMRAPLRRIVKSRLNAADWQVMLDIVEQMKLVRKPKPRSHR